MLMFVFLCLPETIAKREPNLQTEEQKNTSIFAKIFMSIFGPFKALALLRFQPVIVVIWSGVIAFFTMYTMNVSIQAVFGKAPYNFSILEVGLVYLAPTIGYAISSIFGGRWIDHIMVREATKANHYDDNGKLKYFPEDRMRENIWLALALYPASLIWYGWSAEKGVQWAVPCVASICFGLGLMLVMGTVLTALTEFTPKKASSGVAVANFVRNILACTGAVVTQPMLNGIGNGWMCTMIALIAFFHEYSGHPFSPHLGAPVAGVDGPEVECPKAVNVCDWCLVGGQALSFLGLDSIILIYIASHRLLCRDLYLLNTMVYLSELSVFLPIFAPLSSSNTRKFKCLN